GVQIFAAAPIRCMRRTYGSGHLFIKSGAYYVRWRAPDGLRLNRRVGKGRLKGGAGGLTRAQAGCGSRRLVDELSRQPLTPKSDDPAPTVDEVANEVRDRLQIEGARLSYLQNVESMQRAHISPAFGKRRVDQVSTRDIERLSRAMLAK